MKTALVFNSSQIENTYSLECYKKVSNLYVPDLIAGTSTGALIGMLIALEYPLDKIAILTEKLKSETVKIPFIYKVKMTLGFPQSKKLCVKVQNSLKNVFGNLKMSDLKVNFMCNVYNLNTNEQILYKSWKSEHKNLELWKVAMASIAYEPFIDDNGFELINGNVDLASLILPAYVELKKENAYDNIKIVEFGSGICNTNNTQRYLYRKLKQNGDLHIIYDR